MPTLKQQINEKQADAARQITDILQNLVDETGYIPLNISITVIDVTGTDSNNRYIVNTVDLAIGK